MQDKMSQEEIDILMNSLTSTEVEMSTSIMLNIDSTIARKKYKTVLYMISRLEFARANSSFSEQKEARKALHCAAFDLWLFNRNMTRHDYYWLMNKELKKRGYFPIFKI